MLFRQYPRELHLELQKDGVQGALLPSQGEQAFPKLGVTLQPFLTDSFVHSENRQHQLARRFSLQARRLLIEIENVPFHNVVPFRYAADLVI